MNLTSDVTPESNATFHISHERDIAIYTAFCAVKSAMDALVFAAETETWEDPKKFKTSLSVGEQPSDVEIQSPRSSKSYSRSTSLQNGVNSGSEFAKARSVSLRSTDSSVILEMSVYKDAFQDIYTK